MPKNIRSRFVASLTANLLRSVISFATTLLLARWLGPTDYGRMAFLLASFVALRQLLDMASSAAFFTFLSQRPRSHRFIKFYWRWIILQFLVSVLVVSLLLPDYWIGVIWKGEARSLVLMGFIAAFMQSIVWPIASQMAEAQRETIRVQRLNTLVVLMHMVIVVILWWLGKLAIPLLFVALILEWSLAGWYAAQMYQNHTDMTKSAAESDDTAASVWREFLHYCLPFVPYSILGFAHAFSERWMLQHWGGAVEQAYYAVAAQFAAVALLATSSILRIFWKEVAEAHHQNDHVRTGILYKKVSRLMFLVGAIIAGFLIPWAENLLGLILGTAYIGGATTLAIMFIYPVHQSMGQIGGTLLYATNRTSIQAVTGIIFMIVSMVVTYLVIAPVDAIIPGLGLASKGLALKMVVMQIIQVNVIAYIIARVSNWPFDWAYQPLSLFGCLALGWMVYFASFGLLGHGWPLTAVMGFAGLVYLMLSVVFVYAIPWLAGLTRDEININVFKLLQK